MSDFPCLELILSCKKKLDIFTNWQGKFQRQSQAHQQSFQFVTTLIHLLNHFQFNFEGQNITVFMYFSILKLIWVAPFAYLIKSKFPSLVWKTFHILVVFHISNPLSTQLSELSSWSSDTIIHCHAENYLEAPHDLIHISSHVSYNLILVFLLCHVPPNSIYSNFQSQTLLSF